MDPQTVLNRLLDRYLEDLEKGEVQPLEAYQKLFPGHEELVAQEYAQFEEHLRGLLEDLKAACPFSERLRRRYGEGVDPEISLGLAEAPTEERSPDHVLERLAVHAPREPRYRLVGEVARGGMGAILKVIDEDLHRPLAMKVALGRTDPASQGETPPVDPQTLGRFLEEAQVTGQLDHPGIVPVHELGLDSDGRVYFTMRLVRGSDLREVFALVREGRDGWTETRALHVLLKVCEAMAYAHAKGVIHRDLKPGNVMVGRFGEVYVMDWGLAKVIGRKDTKDLRLRALPETTRTVQTERTRERDLDPETPLVTMDGTVVGTPAYMPPEQARGEVEKLDRRSDVYSLGAMLYHLLAGQMPYVRPGARVSGRTILQWVLDGPPARVHKLNPSVPAELEAICDKAMARDPAKRYADTMEMADDLRAYLEGRVVRAWRTGPLVELRKWIQRNRVLAATIGAALLVVLGAAIVVSAMNVEIAGALGDLQRMSDVRRLQDYLRQAEEGLWPAHPEKVAPMTAWLEKAHDLVSRLPRHRERLAELRARALLQNAADPDARSVFVFEDTETQWEHDTIASLVEGLERFADPDPAVGAIADVRERLAFARTIEQRSMQDHRDAWDRAIASIADPEECPAYGGLRMAPQLGLVPIGRDPVSGLWEFVHLQTGEIPERDAEGRLVRTEGMGIVLVLLPGAEFTMGAVPPGEGREGGEPNVDPDAKDDESPLQRIELDPFFLSKYEMTQGQWLRAARENPSYYGENYSTKYNRDGNPWSLLHPVELVSWEDSDRLLRKLDLTLPTEAQWEYAARAGTTTVWWRGNDPDSLLGAANLADLFGMRNEGFWKDGVWEQDDGHTVHAPVGSFAPNGFGLHDVVGNVSELCRDRMGDYTRPVRPGDGYREVSDDKAGRVGRDGSWAKFPSLARSARRNAFAPTHKNHNLGVRPARGIE